jgi:hypothetical protein
LLQENTKYGLSRKSVDETRDILNAGLFSALFKQFAAYPDVLGSSDQKEMGLVGLSKQAARSDSLIHSLTHSIAAVAMHVGATINSEEMDLLRRLYSGILKFLPTRLRPTPYTMDGLWERGFKKALVRYRNDGTWYSFDTPQCTLASCEKCEDEPSGDQKLMKCAKCMETYYCSREHQTAHWRASHKRICKVPDAQTAKYRWEIDNSSWKIGRLAKRDNMERMI